MGAKLIAVIPEKFVSPDHPLRLIRDMNYAEGIGKRQIPRPMTPRASIPPQKNLDRG